MRNLVWKIILIVLVLGLCTWALVGKEIRLGKDLRGGVSLIYRVSIPEGADSQSVMGQTIEVLKDRVNPTGVLDISFQPLGLDRIEVVMPLPNQEVRGLHDAYKSALAELLDRSQIDAAELDLALQGDQAVERYCGDDTTTDRCRQITGLQAAYRTMRDSREALRQAVERDAPPEEIARLEQAEADAEIDYEERYEQVLALSLNRSRMVRALDLATTQEKQRAPDGSVEKDATTGEPLLKPSPRETAIAALKAEFPYVAGRIDTVVSTFDAYRLKRTGLDDPEDLMRLLQGAGVLEFHIAVDPVNPVNADVNDMRAQLQDVGPDNVDQTVAAWYPINDLKQWYDGEEQLASLESSPREFFRGRGLVADFFDGVYYLLLYTSPGKCLTADSGEWMIEQAFRSPDQLGRPAVSFRLDPSGGTLMGQMTGKHVNQPMAIVLDDQVYSAPNLLSQISSSGIITGNFAASEINYLIRVLAAGSLEARLSSQPIAVNTLGPSIGADNLLRGKYAFIIALIAVAIFMLSYYFFAGAVADFALIANGLIIFGVMATIDGTFTLPGLAGIVLTIGMAVDANVLIYERIREELFAGEEDLRSAIRLGYAKALSTIIDANVTNLIVCLVLFKTATAEVKGFALTLTIGICATLFTALFVTRVIFALYTEVFHARRLPMLPTVFPAIHRALEPSIDWIGLRKVFWTLSVIVVALSIFFVARRGVDMFDTEFRGGVTATLVTTQTGDGERKLLAQSDVEQRIRRLSDRASSATDPTAAAVLAEMGNTVVLTSGDTAERDGQVVASAFQIKVASPKGIGAEESITDIVVDAIVDEFVGTGDIDVSPPRTFDGVNGSAAGYVFPVEDDDVGTVIGDTSLTLRVAEYKGGVALVIDNLDPPATIDEIDARIEQMRNQPDFRETSGRKTRVLGRRAVDASDPAGAYESVVVVVKEPNLSSFQVDSDVWYRQLAEPEWELTSAALQRRSSLQQVSSFSSAVAETLSAQAIVAVILSLLGILGYIWIRFGSLRYSAAAIVALVHDVTIALGILALTKVLAGSAIGRMLLIEEFRIDLGVVAALLTIIGYSLNDTIVILDRIRENRGKRPLPTVKIVNRSINQTVSRTVLTSVTTLLAVFIMYAEGGSGIRPFTFTLLIGLVVGTYSSVAIAAPLVAHGKGTEDPAGSHGMATEDTAHAEVPASV